MSSGEFFSAVRPWSHYKHAILQKYLRLWANKLGSANAVLYFVDTHAGAGRYESGAPGSPVLAADINTDKGFSRQGAELRVIACERKPENVLSLSDALAPWMNRHPPLAWVLPGPFGEHLSLLVEHTRAYPTLYFLDSFGMADLSLDALTPILEARERKKEILLRLDHTMFARWTGWLVDRDRSASSQRAAERFAQLLTECDIDPDLARERRTERPHGIGEDLMYAYLNAFRHRFRFVTVAPIRATFTGAPRYFLLHATDSPHGCAHMNDVVSTTRDDLYQRTEAAKADRSGQTSLFEPDSLPTPGELSERDLDDQLLEGLGDTGQSTWIELRAHLACELGPEFRDKHHQAALRRLIARGELTCDTDGRPTARSIIRRR